MTTDRWRRIETLFAELTMLPPEERAQQLKTLEPDDESLRHEVASLLECDLPGESLERIVRAAACSTLQVDASAGERLGSYQVIRKLGQGGMGTVFLAVRADDQYQQQVAIKLLSLGMETAESVERFRRERQILASLEHPYIARLLDGGSAQVAGLPHETPYFVMEFVEGEPVNEYCQRRELDVIARVRLFLKICEAVTYAHRKLVVHRDLKPANILVTSEGVPKLLDFGVAKLLEQDGLGSLQTIAGLGLTPDFASPEQVLEEPITTATDVYSLGAILFLLLTGVKPHRFSNYSASEIRRVICETDAPKLTDSNSSNAAELRGDLEAIVSMAMRREPERRYPSVEQFSADLERYLNGWPVIARPDRFSYRAGKFVRRQAYGLAAAGLVMLSLAIGLVVALYQARRAEAESEHARQRLAQMVDLANVALSESYAERISGATEDHDQFMLSSTELLRQLSRETGNPPRLRAALATAYLRLGELQSDLQSPNRGGLQQAIHILTEGAALLEPLPPLASRRDQSSILQWIDLRTLAGKAMLELGDAAEARKHLQETLRVADGLLSAQPGDKSAVQRETLIQHWISGTYEAVSDYRHAIEVTRGTLQARDKLERAFPDDASVIYDLSVSETRFGYETIMLGDPEGAAAHYLRTIALRERALRLNPTQMVYRRSLKIAYEHMAGLMGSPLMPNLGRPDEARKYLQSRLLEDTAFDDPQRHSAQTDYAHFLMMSAIIDTRPGEEEASLAGLRRAAAVYEDFAALEPDLINNGGQLSTIYTYMGHRLFAQTKFPQAVSEYSRGLAVAERILSKLPGDEKTFSQVLEASRGRARSLASSGDRAAATEAAEKLQIRAGESRSTDAAVRATHLANARLTLAEVDLTLGNRNAARLAARDAIARIQPYVPASLRRSDRRAILLREAQAVLSASEIPPHSAAVRP